MGPLQSLWAIALVGSVLGSGSVSSSTAIRLSNDRIREVFAFAMSHSPSFRDLVATLEQTEHVVYVEEGRCRGVEHGSCLQVPLRASKTLVVRMNPRLPMRAAAAQLAHELYHAAEVAREPDVTDEASMRELYARIGEKSCADGYRACWDTRAARAFETLVNSQLTKR